MGLANSNTFAIARKGNQSITLSCDQWNELRKQERSILVKVLCYEYVHRNFVQSFESITGGPLLDELPGSFDVSLGTAHVLDAFRQVFKRTVIVEGELTEPKTMAEELWGNDPKAIYATILSIEIDFICNMFYSNLKDAEPFLCLVPHMYVSKIFFKTLSWENIFNELFEYLCPTNTFEHYQCLS